MLFRSLLGSPFQPHGKLGGGAWCLTGAVRAESRPPQRQDAISSFLLSRPPPYPVSFTDKALLQQLPPLAPERGRAVWQCAPSPRHGLRCKEGLMPLAWRWGRLSGSGGGKGSGHSPPLPAPERAQIRAPDAHRGGYPWNPQGAWDSSMGRRTARTQ